MYAFILFMNLLYCIVCLQVIYTMKVFLFVDTNYHGFCKMHWSMGSWIVVSNSTDNNQWENCITLDFNFRKLSEPRNPRKQEPPRAQTYPIILWRQISTWESKNKPNSIVMSNCPKHVRFGPTSVPDFTKKQHYPSILCMITILSVFQCYYYTIKP